jgi:hypothetical protein
VRNIFVIIALLFAGSAAAQTSTPQATPVAAVVAPASPAGGPRAAQDAPLGGLQLGLTFEGFYEYNWNRPFDRVNLLRAYDTRSNSFGIQQVALVLDFAPDVDAGRRVGGRLDLQFGQATDTVQGNPANEPRPEGYRHVWQAYGSYVFDIGRGLQVDFGKFASNLGYETNYAKDNNNFSRAYLFNFLPFYHSGFRFTLPINDKVTVMYMLTNGIQQTEEFNNFKSSHVTAIVKPIAELSWTASYYAGQEQPDGAMPGGPDGFFRVFDTYITYTPTAKLSFGVDVNHVTNQVVRGGPKTALQGTGAYARVQATDRTAFAVRYERLDDEGLFGGIAQILHEATVTIEGKLADGFLIRGEFRRDWSNAPFFTTRTPDELRRAQNTALLGLVWWFGNKSGAW